MWYNKLNEVVKNDIVTVIVGNKLDLERQREVDPELVKDLASKWGCGYIECSALTQEGLPEVFNKVIESTVNVGKTSTKKGGCTLL